MFQRIILVVILGSLLSASCGLCGERVAVGRMFSPVGTLLVREGSSKNWKHPQLFDEVYSGDRLLVLPGAKAVVDLKEGDVHLTLLGNLPELSNAPVLECAAVFHPGGDFDADLSLDTGRVLIENRRKKGPLKIRCRVHEENVDVLLPGPDSVIALERYSRWPPGTPFVKKAEKGREPENHLVLLILKGKAEVEVKAEKHTQAGPIVYHWSGVAGLRGPVHLQELPKWLKASVDAAPQTTAWYAAVESLRRRLAMKELLREALTEAFAEKDQPLQRSVAVFSAAAAGELGLVLAGLDDGKSKEVRRAAAVALHHQIGRSQAADIRLYKLLLEKKFSAGQAEIVMHLLHGFGGKDRARPETYETLINYLQHQKMAVRELAAWNLYQLVPQGKNIVYDAAAPADQRARAQTAWRKLIPEGQLPKS